MSKNITINQFELITDNVSMATLFAISGDPVHPNWKCGRYRSKWFSMTIWIIDLKFSMSGVNSPNLFSSKTAITKSFLVDIKCWNRPRVTLTNLGNRSRRIQCCKFAVKFFGKFSDFSLVDKSRWVLSISSVSSSNLYELSSL